MRDGSLDAGFSISITGKLRGGTGEGCDGARQVPVGPPETYAKQEGWSSAACISCMYQ